MVRTRHSGDNEVEGSPKFMSLDNERGRDNYSVIRRNRVAGGSESLQVYQEDDDCSLFGDKVVDSRLRPRTGPRRAFNYLDADSSDEETVQLRKSHSPHIEAMHQFRRSRGMKKELYEDCEEISPRLLSTQSDVEEDNYQLRRSSRQRRSQSLVGQGYRVYTRRKGERDITDDEKDREDDEKGDDYEDEEQRDPDDTDNEDQNNEFSDMYSRVKRKRVRVKRYMYDDDLQNRNNNQQDDTDDDEEVTIRTSARNLRKKEPQIVKSYSLREHKPRTDLYKAPVTERKIKKNTTSIFEVTPTKKTSGPSYHSPAQRKKSKKRSAMNSSSSSTSSSSGESSDEKSFKKRKAKSMAKARSRMMPMNFSNSTPPAGAIKDRIKSGASLADVEPMNIDQSITFDSIGGLGKHIRALKEMVVFPLLYDKVFERFNVDPPRGVLFYGPPGTGKTLVARALANECSHGEKRVAFFMRKGADCLSKWVGESERQLRLLFDQAYKYRPSIIFFDEIDGLAPVRSSRQDQIHSSIVSTLLALMDGLDSRGEIVVIGATNRIDSLDPALRRPGRFDREFLFPLPSLEARKQILKIQTKSWNPKLDERFISVLAEKCVGYCGADLKSLCTEAAMLALRRRYPQIYTSNEALQLDVSSITVGAKDFFNAVSNIIPTSRRSVNTPGRPLSLHILPLLGRQLTRAVKQLCDLFPPCLTKVSSLDAAATNTQLRALADKGLELEELESDEDEDEPSIYETSSSRGRKSHARKSIESPTTSNMIDGFFSFSSYSAHRPTTFRPRIMLTGCPGQGQTSYIAPAVIHKMEDLPVHVLDLPALYAVTAKTPEESCANVFHEAKRKCPSIVYMPYINQWWDVLGDTLRTTLLTLIQDLSPTTPLLLLATSEQPYSDLDPQLKSLFNDMSGEVLKVTNPNLDERKTFFQDLLLRHSCKAPPQKKTAAEMVKCLSQSKTAKFLSFDLNGLRRSQRMVNFSKHKEPSVKCTKSEPRHSKHKEPSVKCTKSEPRQHFKGKSRVEIPSAFVKKSIAAAVHQPVVKTFHKMTLRPRRILVRDGNNSCYKKFRDDCCYGTSSGLLFPRVNRFTDIQFSNNHNRLKQTFPGIRSSHRSRTCAFSNTNCSNRHHHISDRHQRYLRRMASVSTSRYKYEPSVAQSCIKPVLNKQLGCHLYCGKSLSSGSVQMLYRKEDKIRPPYPPRRDLALPINIVQLKKCNSSRPGLGPRNGRKVLIPYNLRSLSKHLRCNRFFKFHKERKIRNPAKRMLEVLPKATPVTPRELTSQEMNAIMEKEELTLMELRIFLRDVLHKLGSDKKFSIFTKPVNIENAPDYYDVIEKPMDMSSMMSKIDCHEYATVRSFMDDIDLICSNALEYNPDRGPMDKVIRHRACALKDTAYAIIKTELDKDFEKMCVEIEESRKRRGVNSTTVPNFYRTKPVARNTQSSSLTAIPSYLDSARPARSIPQPDGERYSRRVRGLTIDPSPSLEDVERVARASGSPKKDDKNEPSQNSSQTGNSSDWDGCASQEMNSINESSKIHDGNDTPASEKLPNSFQHKAQTDPLHKRVKTSKCVWCRPSRRAKLKAKNFKGRTPRANPPKSNEGNDGSNQLSSVHQPLNVDVTMNSETEELKSPVRKSSRIISPNISGGGITTRRQSLSPRTKETLDTQHTDLSQGKNSTLDESSHTVVDSSITEDPQGLDKEETGVSEFLEKTVDSLRTVETQAVRKKPSVVKSLDLDFGVVDSGAGSSLDGNGDSRDSMDNKLEEAQPATSSNQDKDYNQNCRSDIAQRATTVLNETPKRLVVPIERLSKVLDRLVLSTEGFNVERLEKIYSQLSQIIYRHRHIYDRADMVTELEDKVAELTRQIPCASSFQ